MKSIIHKNASTQDLRTEREELKECIRNLPKNAHKRHNELSARLSPIQTELLSRDEKPVLNDNVSKPPPYCMDNRLYWNDEERKLNER